MNNAKEWLLIWMMNLYYTEEQKYKIEQRIFDCLGKGINTIK